MRRAPAVVTAALGALGAFLVVAALLAPASAAPVRLGLSWDGRAWGPTLAGTLFGHSGAPVTWVPGDTDTRTFHVRNQSTDDATLAVQYLLPASRLSTAGGLRLAVRVGSGPWRALAPGATWTDLQIAPLDAGRTTTVSVRGTFDWAAPNATEDTVAPVDFRVQLAGIQADTAADDPGDPAGDPVGDPAGDPPAGDGQALAATGAPELGWLTGTSIVCLAGGLLVLAVARRREERDADAS